MCLLDIFYIEDIFFYHVWFIYLVDIALFLFAMLHLYCLLSWHRKWEIVGWYCIYNLLLNALMSFELFITLFLNMKKGGEILPTNLSYCVRHFMFCFTKHFNIGGVKYLIEEESWLSYVCQTDFKQILFMVLSYQKERDC